jgi:hypothetical protein
MVKTILPLLSVSLPLPLGDHRRTSHLWSVQNRPLWPLLGDRRGFKGGLGGWVPDFHLLNAVLRSVERERVIICDGYKEAHFREAVV